MDERHVLASGAAATDPGIRRALIQVFLGAPPASGRKGPQAGARVGSQVAPAAAPPGGAVPRVALPAGATAGEALDALRQQAMQKWDANQVVAAWVNGALADLNTPLEQDAEVFPVLTDSPAGREILRHSTAHAMAQAVLRLFPGAKLAIGPAIDNGFYYDFDLPVPLAPEDLPKITAEMEKIRRENLPIERQEVPRSQAREMFVQKDQPYKVELVDDIPDDTVSLYRQGEFIDLCRGPHLPSTGRLPAFKLESIAGAYWRGDSKRPMLQRIYGWAFPTEQELQEFVHMREEAAARDHRRLGQVLDLFSLHEEGPGFPFWHPKGMVLRNVLEDFWRREHHKAGYQEIRTPIILNEALWHQSGHWDHYRENMYFTRIDDQGYAIKPMNCPGGILVYKRKIHSYRDLPERLAELGLVHRHELSGVLHGLMRVRSFTQDDAHIFCTPEQMKAEIRAVIALADKFYSIFGFPYRLELSTRPENSMGTEEQWERATNALREALEELHRDYQINEGDGAFYGPKIDFHLRDSLGRTWQCGTIQLDFQMPELFDLAYVGEDGQKHRPVMLHRTIFGSIERFIGILIEHFAGAFPTWIAPVQALVLPVTGELEGYARQVARALEDAGFRAEVDARDEKIGYRIREAQVQQVPYMLVVGKREEAQNAVAVRNRRQGDVGAWPLERFMEALRQEVEEKRAETAIGALITD